jgi:cysteine desulfurase / selenocysteine lyase
MTKPDIAAVRNDTPGCRQVTHLNNAGAALMPSPVYTAVTDHFQREFTLGGYEAAAQAAPAIADFYPAVATLLNADADEIAYVENATRAWDMVFYAIPLRRGDRVITHHTEYASNYLAFLQLAKTKGIEIDLAPSNERGQVDIAGLEKLVTPRTRLLAITHVPSQYGLINPVVEIGQIAKHYKILFLLDACQSVGQIPVDVKTIGCDFLTATGRKFLRGPRGTGLLFVNKRVLEQLHPPFIDLQAVHWLSTNTYQLRNDARRFETWERFIAGQIGLAKAVRYASAIGLDGINDRILGLMSHLTRELSKLKHVYPGEDWPDYAADYTETACGILTFSVAGRSVEGIQASLRLNNINVSLVLAKNARLHRQGSDNPERIRVSPHYYNTDEDIDVFCHQLTSLL